MKSKTINALNLDDGTTKEAVQMVCECGSESFIVYGLEPGHVHLQCTECETSHCSKKEPGEETEAFCE